MTARTVDINLLNILDDINKALAFISTLSPDLTAFYQAWIADDLQKEIALGLSLEEALLKIIGQFYPQALLVERALEIFGTFIPPFITFLINLSQSLIPDGGGGWVSQAWRDDPAHQLNPDGTFKYADPIFNWIINFQKNF